MSAGRLRSPSREDARLLRAVDGAIAEAMARAGLGLECPPGCRRCCVGPFPITALDAWRLRSGLHRLAAVHPRRASAVERRARAALGAMSEGFPGDASGGRLDGRDEAAVERFLARHEGLPCPALDPRTGRCDIYAARPLSCRTFGPPVLVGQERLPPCPLCFGGAPPARVESIRIAVDPGGIEDEILSRMPDGDAETLVAFALLGPARPQRRAPALR